MDTALSTYNVQEAVPQISNSVATVGQLRAIQAEWRAMRFAGQDVFGGLPGPGLRTILLRMVVAFANNGTSPKTTYPGVRFNHELIAHIPDGVEVHMDKLVDGILRHCTIRQFAAYYAPLYWNWALQNQTPPAYWQKKGYREHTKYAGFDFFFGVESSASLGGRNKGLEREPTPEERLCNQANSRVLIHRSVQSLGGFQTNIVEVTNGRTLTGQATIGLLPPATNQTA